MEPTKVTINGVEYDFDKLSDKSKLYLQHIDDVDTKLRAKRFEVDQIQFTREALFVALNAQLVADGSTPLGDTPGDTSGDTPAEDTPAQ